MEIKIPFNDWSKERLELMVKRATSRNKKYGNVGDTFKVKTNKNELEFEIELILKLPLWFISEELFESEGCFHSFEFEEVWAGIHPKVGWTPNKEVWYHKFKEL